MTIGAEDRVVKHLDPFFKSVAPGVKTAPRTPGKKGAGSSAENGYLHCGPTGASHFVKMVHNGNLVRGMIAAYAEGSRSSKNANVALRRREQNAETIPLLDPGGLQVPDRHRPVAQVWRRGTVVPSWLFDLTAEALVEDSGLAEFTGRVSNSGEGRWTIAAAITKPCQSLFLAPRSANASTRAVMRISPIVLSAMHKQFGGHDEKKRRGS